ncbi:hypothetical protein [Rhizobium halophytocola]|uniref:DUF3955 domain-containing protein n=1 Tax=Rhizobium halophytocola TaxID=735519 RepID=A0ABS4DYV7_9HYPH|nr:hypothetical protein [Rhizobium halophytocola]MBP1850867.1 hypothetical protein [Rhizobium halophytocola]
MQVKRVALTLFGALVLIVGLLWMAQGTGIFPYPASSFMIDQTPWILYGAGVAVVGAVLLFLARRL